MAQKVKAPADPADEGLVGVLLDVQFRQCLVDQPDRRPELPPGRGKDDPIVHEPGIRQPGLLDPLIQEFEVKRSHQRRERAAQLVIAYWVFRPLLLSAFICEICGQEFGSSSPIGYRTCGVGSLTASGLRTRSFIDQETRA
jgi:hypothetical protein